MSHSPDNSPFSARSAISLVAGAALLFAVFASSAHIHVEDEHESREEGPVCELCIIADRLDDAIGGLEAGLARSAAAATTAACPDLVSTAHCRIFATRARAPPC